MSAREMNSLDDFLDHRSSDRSGGQFLSKWKKDKRVDVWLHTKRLPIALWRHGLPRVAVIEKDGQPERHVWGGNYVCWEDEKVLKAQYRRDENGQREKPPAHCPICRLIDWAWRAVDSGKVDWTKPLFRFEGDDPKETQVLHVGGICNLFGQDDLSEEQKKQLKKAGISQQEAWKENAFAKMSYLFCVVDNAHPGNGVQIAIEANLLGDKVKDVLADARESLGNDKGNPFTHPFCIQWEHRPDEKAFNKKYHARRMERIAITDEISKLIRGPAPDLENTLAPFNKATMRAILEKACLLKGVPWDKIFDVEEPEADTAVGNVPEPEDDAPEVTTSDAAEDDMVACDACGKAMSPDAAECPHCGQKYEVEAAAPPPPPPPPKLRKRSELKAAQATAPDPDPGNGAIEDEIPF